MTNFDDFLNEQLQDEELRKEYEALEPEFAIVQALMALHRQSCPEEPVSHRQTSAS